MIPQSPLPQRLPPAPPIVASPDSLPARSTGLEYRIRPEPENDSTPAPAAAVKRATLREKLTRFLGWLLALLRRPFACWPRAARNTGAPPAPAAQAEKAAARFPSPAAVDAGLQAIKRHEQAVTNPHADDGSAVPASAPANPIAEVDSEAAQAVRGICGTEFEVWSARQLAMQYVDVPLDQTSRDMLQQWVCEGVQRLLLQHLLRVNHPASGAYREQVNNAVQRSVTLPPFEPLEPAALHGMVKESLLKLSKALPLLRSAICDDVEQRQAVVIVMRWLSSTPELTPQDQRDLRHLMGKLCAAADNTGLTLQGEEQMEDTAPPRRVWGRVRG